MKSPPGNPIKPLFFEEKLLTHISIPARSSRTSLSTPSISKILSKLSKVPPLCLSVPRIFNYPKAPSAVEVLFFITPKVNSNTVFKALFVFPSSCPNC